MCMLLADQLRYLGRGRWSSGTFPVRWQCTQTCDGTMLESAVPLSRGPQMTEFYSVWTILWRSHFWCWHHGLKSYEKKSVGRLSQFWLAIWILRTAGNKLQLLESMLPIKGPSTSFMVSVTVRWATGQPSRCPCSNLHDSTASHAAIFLNCAALKFIPNHYLYFLLKNVLFDIIRFFQ